jgi:hypothetical protein
MTVIIPKKMQGGFSGYMSDKACGELACEEVVREALSEDR